MRLTLWIEHFLARSAPRFCQQLTHCTGPTGASHSSRQLISQLTPHLRLYQQTLTCQPKPCPPHTQILVLASAQHSACTRMPSYTVRFLCKQFATLPTAPSCARLTDRLATGLACPDDFHALVYVPAANLVETSPHILLVGAALHGGNSAGRHHAEPFRQPVGFAAKACPGAVSAGQ